MKPLISVVIPVFNEEKRIARAIESMQKQTYQNLEIIVVDDGSSDATAEVVKKIAADDPRVSYHQNPKVPTRANWRGYDINAGWSARNFGFEQAKGEWITTQDADDASLLNRIEVQYEFAKKYNATLVTIQWMQFMPERLAQKLDIERVIREMGEEEVVIRPDFIVLRAIMNRGILMYEPLHQFIPFTLKWFPYTRKLFYRRRDIYPGADNSMLFVRKVIDDGMRFRPRNCRTWGSPDGRGSGRDFAYSVAMRYKNSYSLKFPMYLWDVNIENRDYPGYEKYLV